jgi:hypothetical protein
MKDPTKNAVNEGQITRVQTLTNLIKAHNTINRYLKGNHPSSTCINKAFCNYLRNSGKFTENHIDIILGSFLSAILFCCLPAPTIAQSVVLSDFMRKMGPLGLDIVRIIESISTRLCSIPLPRPINSDQPMDLSRNSTHITLHYQKEGDPPKEIVCEIQTTPMIRLTEWEELIYFLEVTTNTKQTDWHPINLYRLKDSSDELWFHTIIQAIKEKDLQ